MSAPQPPLGEHHAYLCPIELVVMALAVLPADDYNHVLLNDLNVLSRIQFAHPVTGAVMKTCRELWEEVKATGKTEGQ